MLINSFLRFFLMVNIVCSIHAQRDSAPAGGAYTWIIKAVGKVKSEMKCCSMKLANRAEERHSFFEKSGSKCHPSILQNRNNYSRFSLSQSSTDNDKPSEDDQPYLSVLNIILPKNIKAFNTGSSTQRWAHKRPRLRSAKSQKTKDENLAETDLDSLDVSNLIKELESDCSEEESNVLKSEDELDADIQRLLTESNKNDIPEENEDIKRTDFDLEGKPTTNDGVKRKSKRRHKKKSKDAKDKEKSKSKKKLTKTVSFSLSKPPTPQTEQVIRVDVISNYSVEFDIVSNRTDGMSSEQTKVVPENSKPDIKNDGNFVFHVFCTEKHDEAKNFVLESKKAVLFSRNMEK